MFVLIFSVVVLKIYNNFCFPKIVLATLKTFRKLFANSHFLKLNVYKFYIGYFGIDNLLM